MKKKKLLAAAMMAAGLLATSAVNADPTSVEDWASLKSGLQAGDENGLKVNGAISGSDVITVNGKTNTLNVNEKTISGSGSSSTTGISLSGGSLELTGGGTISNFYRPDTTPASVSGDEFGAIDLRNAAQLTITGGDWTLSGNTSGVGSINALNSSISANVDKIVFDGNISNAQGAGFRHQISDNAYIDNSASIIANEIKFNNNEIKTVGELGPAVVGSGAAVMNSGGTMELLGGENTFTNNKMNATIAEGRQYKVGGGAVINQSHQMGSGDAINSTMAIGKTDGTSINTFSGNTSSTNGGAVMNRAVDEDGNAELTINGTTTFSNNTAAEKGGAIYNIAQNGRTAELTLNGTNTFTGNTANGVANDIYNEGGIVNINGEATLNGGIDGNGETVATNQVNIAGNVEVGTALKNQTVAVNSGELHLAGVNTGTVETPVYTATNRTGSAITVKNGATINTIDNLIQDYTTDGTITLQNGAIIKGDLDLTGDGTADKYLAAATDATVKYSVGSVNLIHDASDTNEKEITLINQGNVELTDVSYDSSVNYSFATSTEEGKTNKLFVKKAASGINGAVETTTEGEQININYNVTADESYTGTGAIENSNFNITGDGVHKITLENDLVVDGGSTSPAVPASSLTIDNAKLTGEGALVNEAGATLDINNSLVDVYVENHGNMTSDPTTYKGGIANYEGATATIEGDTFTDIDRSADAQPNGGAIWNEAGGNLTLNNDTFTNNKAAKGGALYNEGTATITGGTFNNNTATGLGGAIYSKAGFTINSDGAAVSFANNADGSGANDIYMEGPTSGDPIALTLNAIADTDSITLGSGINGSNYSVVVNNGTAVGTVNAGNITDAKRIILNDGTFNAGNITQTGDNTTSMIILGDVEGTINSANLSAIERYTGNYDLTFNNASSIGTLSMTTDDKITANGNLTVAKGSTGLGGVIDGTGDLIIDNTPAEYAFHNASGGLIKNNIQITEDGVFETDASNTGVAGTTTRGIIGSVANAGTLVLRGGTLIDSVTGDGDTYIGDYIGGMASADSVNFADTTHSIAQNVNIMNGATLTADGANLAGDTVAIQQGGKLILTGGELAAAIGGYTPDENPATYGNLTVSGDSELSNVNANVVDTLNMGAADTDVTLTVSNLTVNDGFVTTHDSEHAKEIAGGTLTLLGDAVTNTGTISTNYLNIGSYTDSENYDAAAVTNSGLISSAVTIAQNSSLTTAGADDVTTPTAGLSGNVTNAGTLNLTGDTLVSTITSTGNGSVAINGDVTVANGAGFSGGNLTLTSGTLDVNTANASGDVNLGVATLTTGAGIIDVQDEKAGNITLGVVDATSGLNVKIDTDLAKTDKLIFGEGTTVGNGVVLNNIALAADSGAESHIKMYVTDNTITDATKVTFAEGADTIHGANVGYLTLTTGADENGVYIMADHSSLDDAITSSIVTKTYELSANEQITNDGGALDLGGTSLTIVGNGYTMSGHADPAEGGIVLTSDSQTLTLDPITVSGFSTAIDNTIGGTVNLIDVTMQNNTVDVINNGEGTKGVFITGTNTIGKIQDSTADATHGQVTIGNNDENADVATIGTLTQKNVNILSDGKLVINASNLTVADNNSIQNAGNLTLTGGTIGKQINGTGHTDITTDAVDFADTSTAINQAINITGGSLTANGGNIGGAVNNTVEEGLILTGGSLAQNVSGAGSTDVTGTVEFASGVTVAQAVNVGTDDGGDPPTVVPGNLTNKGSIAGNVVVNNQSSLTNDTTGLIGSADPADIATDGYTLTVGTHATADNKGTINVNELGTWGNFTNEAGATINATGIENTFDGTENTGIMTNAGTINSNITNKAGATGVAGTLTNESTGIINGEVINQVGGTYTNENKSLGAVGNFGTFENSGQQGTRLGTVADYAAGTTNHANATLNNNAGGDIFYVVNEATGTVNNKEGAVIANIDNGGIVDNAGTIKGGVENYSTGHITSNADNITSDSNYFKNDGTVTFTGGTIQRDIVKYSDVQVGNIEIDAGTGTVKANAAKSITDNKITLTSGTFDVTSKAEENGDIDFTAAATGLGTGLIANGGTLSVQDGKTGNITLGDVDTSTANLNVMIDADFSGVPTETGVVGTADKITGSTATSDASIAISDIAISLPPAEPTKPSATEFSAQIADAASAQYVDVTATTLSGAVADIGGLEFDYNNQTGWLTGKHSDLEQAIKSSIEQKLYIAGDENVTAPADDNLTMGGTSLSVTANDKTITGGDYAITLASSTQTLSISGNAGETEGVATLDGFATAIDNTVGGDVNLTNVTFTNSGTDEGDANVINGAGGDLNIAGTVTLDTSIENAGDVTVANGATLTGGTLNNNAGGNVDNTNGGIIESAIVNAGESAPDAGDAGVVETIASNVTGGVDNNGILLLQDAADSDAENPNVLGSNITGSGDTATEGYISTGDNTIEQGALHVGYSAPDTAAPSVLTNASTITLTDEMDVSSQGSVLNNGTIEAGSVKNEGNITNAAEKTITATGNIDNEAGAVIENNGTITASQTTNAAAVYDGETLVTPAGVITSVADGLIAANGVLNDGTLNLNGTAMDAEEAVVLASDVLTGPSGAGVTNITGQVSVAAEAGENIATQITGQDTINIGTASGAGLLDNAGTVEADYINITEGSTLENTGSVEAGAEGIDNDGTIDNDSEITSAGNIVNDGSIDNDANATIETDSNVENNGAIVNAGGITADGNVANAADATINNTGDITANLISNAEGGVITSVADGLIAANGVDNDGTLNLNEGTDQGELASIITGDGTTNIAGDVTTHNTTTETDYDITQGIVNVGASELDEDGDPVAAEGSLTNTATVTADNVNVTEDGQLDNTAGASVVAGAIDNYGTITNAAASEDPALDAGSITASNGITNEMDAVITNAGDITATGGDILNDMGTIGNTGVIKASVGDITNNVGDITNTGTFEATAGDIINDGGTISNTGEGVLKAGNVIANKDGSTITTTASGIQAAVEVQNGGDLNLTGSNDPENPDVLASNIVEGDAEGYVNITGDVATKAEGLGSSITGQEEVNVGTIDGEGEVTGVGSLTNAGEVEADYVDVYGGSTLNNEADATVEAGSVYIVDGTVNNAAAGEEPGSVAGAITAETGVYNEGGTVNNEGNIESTNGEIWNSDNGTINNTGAGVLKADSIYNEVGSVINTTASGIQATGEDGVDNAGALNLNGDEEAGTDLLASVINDTMGTGITTVSGDVDTNGNNITQDNLYVGANGVDPDTGLPTELNLTDANFTNDADIELTANLAVTPGAAEGEGATLTNEAEATITAGENIANLEGTINNEGEMTAGYDIVNEGGEINNSGVITAEAGNPETEVGGIANYDGGVINNTGDLVSGDVIENDEDSTINTVAAGIRAETYVDNDGDLNLNAGEDGTRGALASDITGDGNTTVSGNVTSARDIAQDEVIVGANGFDEDGNPVYADGSLTNQVVGDNAGNIVADEIWVTEDGILNNEDGATIGVPGTDPDDNGDIENEGQVNINGGTVIADEINTWDGAETNITGGDVDANEIYTEGDEGSVGTTNITGGDVTVDEINNEDYANTNITGGDVTAEEINNIGNGTVSIDQTQLVDSESGNPIEIDPETGLPAEDEDGNYYTIDPTTGERAVDVDDNPIVADPSNVEQQSTGSVVADAINNSGEGTTNIDSVVQADEINAVDGTINVNATDGETSTSELLLSTDGEGKSVINTSGTGEEAGGTVAINTDSDTMTIDNNVEGDGTGNLALNGNGPDTPIAELEDGDPHHKADSNDVGTVFNIDDGTIVDATNIEVAQGQFDLEDGSKITGDSSITVDPDATLNAMDGKTTNFDNNDPNNNIDTTFEDGSFIKGDVNIIKKKADNFANSTENGNEYLTDLNIKGAEKIVHNSAKMNLTKAMGLNNIQMTDALVNNLNDRYQNILTPIRYLNGKVEMTDDGLMLKFVPRGNEYKDFNPAVMASPVATQLGGYLTQLASYDQAFNGMDMYMLMTSKQRQALKLRNKIASVEGGNIAFDPIASQSDYKGGWFKPYASFETVPMYHGPKVENNIYGSYFGGESEMKDLGNGWDGMWGAYVGYNGAHQNYDGVGIYENGGSIGLVGMAYKENFFAGATVNVGAMFGDANTMYGTDNFGMIMSGIAAKTGYNWELADGKFIIQPSLMAAYSFVDTFDYTNAAGVHMTSDALHAITVEPGVKFIGNLKNGWQPYAGASVVFNIMDRTHFMANDVSLPAISVNPYAKYGVGLRKTWGERFSGFFQGFLMSGGRNGIGLQGGFKWAIGADGTGHITSKDASTPTMKKTTVNLQNKKASVK